jgi:hypothetical protein
LSVGQAKRAQGVIEAPSQSPGGALDMKAEARIANLKSCLKRRICNGRHDCIILSELY